MKMLHIYVYVCLYAYTQYICVHICINIYANTYVLNICIYTHIHSGILLSCKNEIVNNASKWVELEDILLNEVTQTQEIQVPHVLL